MLNENSKRINKDFAEVSVIIPHYNSTATISRAVKSILAQTYEVLEIIIVDDGSKADEKERLRNIQALSPKLQLQELERNQGPASARNAGWDSAKGDWIAFLDSDDAWHPRKLEFQMRAIETIDGPVSVVGSGVEVLKKPHLSSPSWVFSLDAISNLSTWQLLLKNQLATSTVIIRKDLPLRFSNGRKYSEDYELWLRVASTNPSVIKVDLPLTYYFKALYGESGLSSQMMSMALGELETFRLLYKSHDLSSSQFVLGFFISAAKSVVRLSKARLGKVRSSSF